MPEDNGKVAEEQEPKTSAALDSLKRHPLVRLAVVLLPALVTSVAAYTGAGQVAGEKAGEVKDKAEAGYQVTLETLKSLREETRRLESRLVRLDSEVTAIKRAIKRNAPAIRVQPAPPPIQAAAPAPAPLPGDLDKALQVKAPELQAKP